MSSNTSSERSGAGEVEGSLEVLCQSPIAPDPGEEPFNNPAPWLNCEADLIGVLAYDLDRDQRGVCAGGMVFKEVEEEPPGLRGPPVSIVQLE